MEQASESYGRYVVYLFFLFYMLVNRMNKPMEWWIDDIGDRICGPWTEVSEMSWPDCDKVYHAIEYSAYEELKIRLKKACEALHQIDLLSCDEATRLGSELEAPLIPDEG